MSYKEFAKALINTGPSGATMGPEMPILDLSNPSHQFPSDLWSPGQEPFIYFNIRPSIDPTSKPVGNISMYMPPTIKVSYGAGWEEFTMDAEKMKSLLGIDINSGLKSLTEGNMGGVYDATIGSIKQNASLSNIAKYVTGNIADSKLGSSYGQAIRKAMAGKNQVPNPFTSLMYQGPRLRQFQLDFSLYARNSGESESIRRIIKAFKLAMHPNAEGGNMGLFFDFPYVFDIFFLTPAADQMFNIRRAVLTDMNVDYAGAGTPSFFNLSWAPVDIRMNLVFKELELLTQTEIDQNY